MKKIFYVGALAVLTACTGNSGYTIDGVIEGAHDGDSIFLVNTSGRQLEKLGGAAVKDGKFQIKGVQDETAMRYLMYHYREDDGQVLPFFLENGNIQVMMNETNPSATGTATNDAYQPIRAEVNDLQNQMETIFDMLGEENTTEEQMAELNKKAEELEQRQINALIDGTKKNITNEVGIYLLKNNYYYMETPQLAEIVNLIPEKYASDESIQRIKEMVTKLVATAVGQKFTDFEMDDPDGKKVKLSDYAGKGKVVLVDFWASWCGPCRQEMPNVVKVYKEYKNKGFEIVGVSLDQTAEAWKKGIADLGMTWPQMSDLKYWQSEAASLYGVNAIPHTVLIDKDGTIIERNLRGEKLYEKIAELTK
ncbi:MAG: AhpC/TSA family protein [Bacteroidaceae bacterium]|nr:AhpC/TSA family protein [Bacteroidaceae bacterium]